VLSADVRCALVGERWEHRTCSFWSGYAVTVVGMRMGREEATVTRTVNPGLKLLLMQVGTENTEGAPTSETSTCSGRFNPLMATPACRGGVQDPTFQPTSTPPPPCGADAVPSTAGGYSPSAKEGMKRDREVGGKDSRKRKRYQVQYTRL